MSGSTVIKNTVTENTLKHGYTEHAYIELRLMKRSSSSNLQLFFKTIGHNEIRKQVYGKSFLNILVDTNVITVPMNKAYTIISNWFPQHGCQNVFSFFRYVTVFCFDGENTASQTGPSAGLHAPTVPAALWN